MKNIYKNLITLTLLLLGSISLQAQCPYNNSLYVSIGAPTTIGASVGEECIFPGEYIRVTGMQAGSTYRISTCNTTDVADTRITVYAQGGSGGALTFNDDFCGLLSRVDFTVTSNGSYDILVDQTGPGNTCESSEECVDLSITLIGTSGSTDYCIPTYTFGTANGDFINGVNLESIDNQNSGSVGGPAYSDFTNLSTNLSSSTSYTLSVRNNPDYTEIVSAWIDYNQDFQFSEDERLGQVTISANQTGLLNFTTPANVLPGSTRLRVRMVFSVPTSGGLVSACGSSSVGETEDYTVNFTSNNPPPPPGALSFQTSCGLGSAIQDNACPNYTLATVEVGGLTSLGSNHILSSAEIIVTHAMAADLDIYLEGPDGTVVELSTDNGGAGANYGIYSISDCSQTALFSMAATTPISGSLAPFVGSYIPEGDLNDFNQGTNPNGFWRLRVCDDFAGDAGVIQFVKLNFALNATEPPACAENFNVTNGSGNISLDQQLSWSAGAGNPTAYDVYFGTDENNLTLVSEDQTETTFAPGTLEPSTVYFYQIVPSNNAGDAVGCSVISFTTVADDVTTILMSNGQSTTCDANFFDSGGPNGNTSLGGIEPFVYTIFPDAPNSAVQVDFSSFELGEFDLFGIADGADGNADVVYFYPLNNPEAPGTITATNPTGALTFVFQADPFVTQPGWAASITCVPFGSVPSCVESSTPSNNSLAVSLNAEINWVAGSGEPTGYDVYFGTDMNPPLVASDVAATTYNPGVLINETTYYYQIVPSNASGSATDCPINSFVTVADAGNVVLINDGAASLCEGFFYDSGNSSGDYGNGEDFELTITPDSPNSAIEVEFSNFSIEEEFDVLTVYSGTGIAGPVLGTLTGTVAGPFSFTSVSPDGALTFVFTSDFQVSGSGWQASISCVEPLLPPGCVTPISPEDGSVDVPVSGSIASWSPNAGGDVLTYDLFFGTDEFNLTLVSDDQAESTFNLPDLENNTVYFWLVVPSNLVGTASDCPIFSFRTAEAVEAPSCAEIVSPANGATDVPVSGSTAEWTAGAGGDAPDSYDLFFGTDAGNLALVSDNQVGTSFSLPNLDFATQYFWQVVPSNEAGEAVDCPIVSFTTESEATTVWDIIVNSDVHTTLESLVILAELDGALQGPGPLTVFAPTDDAFALLPTEVVDALLADPTGALAQVLLYHVVAGQTLSGDLVDGQQIVTLNTGTVTVTITVDGIFINDAQVILADQLADNGVVHVIDAVLIPAEEPTEIIMQNGSLTVCQGTFTDDGGSDANYSNDQSLALTLTPEISGNILQVDFSSFQLENNFEFLTIYDGNSNASPLIGSFTGVNSPGLITSSAVDGSLTFEFVSDVSVTFPGWIAEVACVDPNTAPLCAEGFSPADGQIEVSVGTSLSWTNGGGVVVGYDVFFGTDPDNLVLVSASQVETTFTPGALELNTTYYWQVVPLGATASAESCAINSFVTQENASILMQEGTVTICAANFFDEGGPDNNYPLNVDQTLTITPDQPGNLIQVTFTSFALENTWDFLTIFDGSTTADPIIGVFTGTTAAGNIPTGPILSTAADGSLTFNFTSDASATFAGWSATIECINPNAVAECAQNFAPANSSTEISPVGVELTWQPGASLVTGYDVFFGTDPDNLVLVSSNQIASSFAPGDLDLNTTYYWQVIPTNDNGSATDCIVNSFTTSSVVDILMTNATVTTCDANFFDSGGVDGNYALNEDFTLTIFPDQPNNSVQVNFSSFDIEENWEFLTVFDGSDINAPVIGVFSGDNFGGIIPTGPITSSAADGSLTFNFTSDASFTLPGWEATVTCVSGEELPGCITNANPSDVATDVDVTTILSWIAGSGVTLGYDVFFGTDPDNLVLVSDDQLTTTFDPGQLELNTTYYWQVVPFNNSGSALDCPVQSFTTAAEINLVMFNGEVTLCEGTLFDSGGPDGNYQNNEDFTLTVFPATPGSLIQAEFISSTIENGFDNLDIYSGSVVSGTPDVTLTGAALPPILVSSAADGSLTFNFTSDVSVAQAGFEIVLTCFTPAEAPSCSENYLPVDQDPASPLNTVLSWSGVGFPTGYNVFFGTDPDNLVEVASSIGNNTFNPGPLDPLTTYFWQIVPFNDLGSAEGCPVLSFTTAESSVVNMFTGEVTTCFAEFYDPQGPVENYLNNQFNTLTVFPDAADNVVRVTFSSFNVETNFETLTIFSGPTATGIPIATLTGIIAVPAVFTSASIDGALTFVWESDASVTRPGWEALLECVSTTDIPGCVTNPIPADGAVDISSTLATLSWGLGSGIAFSYDVYFGTDPDNLVLVSPGQTGTSFNPGQLDLNTTYYWQVIPTNAAGAPSDCPINSFTTSGAIDILMSNATVTTCSANFYDSGNLTGNYSPNEDFTLTIFPDQPGNSVQVTFTSFNIENTWEFLTVFNGNSTAAPIINTFTGNAATGTGTTPSAPITSSAADGSLTFNFTSDTSVNLAGWVATVTCIDATQPPACIIYTQGPIDGSVDICVNEAQLAWTSGAGAPATAYDVYFDFGGGLILVSDDQVGTTFDPGVLSPNTTYSYQVVPSNANGEAIDCPVISFTTGTCLNYCDAAATICDEFIADVQMGNINNPTACTPGGYNDYTDQSTDVYIGTSSAITVVNGSLQWPQDLLGIWIDWNQDGTFDDPNETITVNGSPGVGPYTADIIPPADALLGPTRMRIRVTFGGVLDPCGTTTFGEVEDYTVIVNEALACPFPNNIVSSETTTSSTVITWNEVTDALEYQIRYRLASEDETVATWTTPIIVPAPLTFTFLENLIICENYILQIGSVCEEGATDIVFSSNISFSTRCIDCLPEYTLEGEDCGSDVNGGCNSTPAAFGQINCGETICGTSFFDGATRDTDWYNFDVTEEGVFQVNILAEFDGTVLFADASDCANITVPSQANFSAGQSFTFASTLTPGTWTVIIIPIFEQAVFDCSSFNGYTLTLSSGETQIAQTGDVCETSAPFNLFAIPAGGTWSGDGITDAENGTFDPASVGVGSYVVTYTPNGAGCSVADSITIVVEEAPEADFVGLAATYCPGADDVVLTGIPAGGTFSMEPSVPGAIAGNVFIPSLCEPGTYEITYVVSVGSSSCAGSITQTVEVLDSPIATIDGLAAAVCTQDDVISLSGTPADGTFSGLGVVDNTFDPMLAGTGIVTITYTASVEGFECPAITTADIQVNPSPIVSIGGISGDYCLNSSAVALQGLPALGTFFIDGVESSDGVFNPADAGLGAHTIRYEFDNGTCVGFSELTVNVIENITLTFDGTPTEVCSEDNPFLIQTSPAGATLSGLGVFGSTFSPKVAGPGSHVITASYSNGNCTATATQTIVVNASPAASFTYNVNGATVSFNNSSLNATSYTWDFGDGATSTSVNPTHTYSTNGSYVITLTASNADCGSSVFTAELELSVGIGSIEGVDMIQLYPNPTGGMINLVFNSLNQQSFEVRIADATGRLIEVDALTNYVGKFNKQYDLTDKAKGVYFFTITSDKGSINFRVVRD